jgi:hypothetical protein
MKRTLLSPLALLIATAFYVLPAAADPDIAKYIGDAPDNFADGESLAAVLKTELEAKNVDGLAKLIGLNAAEIGKSEGFDERLTELQNAAKERLQLVDAGPDRRIILLGELVWPFPFPVVKVDDRWQFDTEAGLEEILDRRIGENELETIDTARNYIQAQNIYHSEDRDGDGVLEYAQALRSPPGTKDGLYWPSSYDGTESPAGEFVDESRAADTEKNGYFGYRYRVLTSQGENIAGGAYDYVINGNMLAGFALIATPVRYGETGIKTFVVSHNGGVYEKDLGEDTEKLAAEITSFNPDQSWELVED